MKYTVQFAKPTDFKDFYGNTGWTVKFTNEADICLWLTKSEPKEGLEVEGEILDLPTRSGGTYRRFKKAQVGQTVDLSEVHKKLDQILRQQDEILKVIVGDPDVEMDQKQADLDAQDINLEDIPF